MSDYYASLYLYTYTIILCTYVKTGVVIICCLLRLSYSGKLSREKTFARISEKYDFCGENFHRLLTFAVPKDTPPQNFAEKMFTNSHKTVKFAKVFSLESFPYVV